MRLSEAEEAPFGSALSFTEFFTAVGGMRWETVRGVREVAGTEQGLAFQSGKASASPGPGYWGTSQDTVAVVAPNVTDAVTTDDPPPLALVKVD